MDTASDRVNQVAIGPGVALAEAALRFTFSRSSGPGGQNVNKLNTRATLTVFQSDLEAVLPAWAIVRLRDLAGQRLADDPPRLVIHADGSRSQRANREACLLKLRELVVRALNRPRRRRPTKPSRAAIQRRLDAKKARGAIKNQRQPPRSGEG